METNIVNTEHIPIPTYSIGLGEFRVGTRPQAEEHWVIYGLGSCIGLILCDWHAGISGMAHIVLPDHIHFNDELTQPAKYAASAVPFLLQKMERLGSRKFSTRSYIVGGACMLNLNLTDIGAKNTERIREVLKEHAIPIEGESVGGNHGRTLVWNPLRKRVVVNRVGAVELVLSAN